MAQHSNIHPRVKRPIINISGGENSEDTTDNLH